MAQKENLKKTAKTIVYCDGSSLGNPGPGGWGAIVAVFDDHGPGKVWELGGSHKHTTNNAMELTAALRALESLSSDHTIEIRTDSSYVINGITKWVHGWARNGWMTKAKEPVANREIWEKLARAVEAHTITWRYVPGHSGVAGNERVDEIATTFAEGRKPNLYAGPATMYEVNLTNVAADAIVSKVRSESKERSKLKAFSYLSLVNKVCYRDKNWADCEARVKHKTGVKFRKAVSAEDEAQILKDWGVDPSQVRS